jgi:Mg2+/Co2+ transporter CorB
MIAWSVSFICSGFEIGFLSVNELKINALAQKGNKFAKVATRLLKDKEKALTTLLIGNNIALVLMTFAFGKIILCIFTGNIPEMIEEIVLTIIVFITCELFPKSLFRIYSFELTYRLSILIFAFHIIFYPISLIFKFVSENIKPQKQTPSQNHKLNEVATEGARRRLLPLGVSILVNKFHEKNLRFNDICKDIKTTTYCGKKNICIDSTQFVDEIINNNVFWNCDTVECTDTKNNVYYPTTAILDSIFINKKNKKL